MTTQIFDTRSDQTRASFLPINKLSVHDSNVRRTDKRADIEALAASIEAHGLLQNLTVVSGDDGRYAVVAGGRRLAALKLLAKQGRIARDFTAPCQIVPHGAGAEASLAENVQRLAMNVMDEVDAFEGLVAAGQTTDHIARRFGTTLRHVEQRLALARLSPKIKAAYRRAELTLDAARAFCLSDDHAMQEKVFKWLAKPITHAQSVRAALTEGRMPAHDRLARFVGVDVYEASGGRVSRDLFEDQAIFLDDSDLVQRLAIEKADAIRADLLAQGWGWAEVNLGYARVDGCASERLRPAQRALTPEEQQEHEELTTKIEALDAALIDADEEDPRWVERDAMEATLNALQDRTKAWDPAQMRHAGVVVSIEPNGQQAFAHGVIKRTDQKALNKVRRAVERHPDRDDSSAPCATEQCDDGDHQHRLPKAVVLSLTGARTRALRAELARSPHVALAVLIDALAQRSFCRGRSPALDIVTTPKTFDDAETFLEDRDGLAQSFGEPATRLQALLALSIDDLTAALAVLVAETLDVTHVGALPEDHRLQAAGDRLASALGLDMRRWWTPTEAFWSQVPKSFTIDALRSAPSLSDLSEGERHAMLSHLAKMKKADLAGAAAQALEGTGWLPDVLVTPEPEGAFVVTPEGEDALTTAV